MDKQEVTALREENEELKQRLSDVEEEMDKTHRTLDDFMQVFVFFLKEYPELDTLNLDALKKEVKKVYFNY